MDLFTILPTHFIPYIYGIKCVGRIVNKSMSYISIYIYIYI